jgi:hypothetical protein
MHIVNPPSLEKDLAVDFLRYVEDKPRDLKYSKDIKR